MFPLLKGVLLTAGMVMPIGPQNIELIRAGVLKEHVFIMATVFVFCDIVLILAGAAGLSSIIGINAKLASIANYMTAGMCYYFGYQNIKNMFLAELTLVERQSQSKQDIFYKGIFLSFFNPLVVLQNVVLVGGASSQYILWSRVWFILGSIIVSVVWFYGMAYFAYSLVGTMLKTRETRVYSVINGCGAFCLIIIGTYCLLTAL